MKYHIPGILIFCTVAAAVLGVVYIVLGALLNAAAPDVLSSARPITTYLIMSGAFALAAGGLSIAAGLLYPVRRTISGWLLIAAGLFCLPGILSIFIALPLFRSSSDVFRNNPPFLTFQTSRRQNAHYDQTTTPQP